MMIGTQRNRFSEPGKIKVVMFCIALSIFALIGPTTTAEAAITSVLIDSADNSSISGASYYNVVAWTQYVNPSATNWIAWHDSPLPIVGTNYVGSDSWIGVDDWFTLSVTNPSAVGLALIMDYNDAYANSSGPQAVIFGTAASAPDVHRWTASWSQPVPNLHTIFNEAGAFNSIFDTAGTYRFSMTYGDGNPPATHPNMYILTDANPVSAVPEPASIALVGIGSAVMAFIRKRKTA